MPPVALCTLDSSVLSLASACLKYTDTEIITLPYNAGAIKVLAQSYQSLSGATSIQLAVDRNVRNKIVVLYAKKVLNLSEDGKTDTKVYISRRRGVGGGSDRVHVSLSPPPPGDTDEDEEESDGLALTAGSSEATGDSGTAAASTHDAALKSIFYGISPGLLASFSECPFDDMEPPPF